jgi:hypothetical protein
MTSSIGISPGPVTDLSARIVALDALLAAGRWTRLSSELDLIEQELASATSNSRDTERTVAALLGRRDELRGLFAACRTAPCDLTAAADAVNRFQRAVLAIGAQRL